MAAWGEYRKRTTGSFQIFDGRGVDIILGMNFPGVKQGLDANAWLPNVESWRAKRSNASTTDMALAAASFRLANPQETAEYIWYRATEFLNLRIPLLLQSGFEGTVRANAQLLIGLSACILLWGTRARSTALMVWTMFLTFMTTFLLIYSESRYRLPMDQFLTLGTIALVAIGLFGKSISPPRRQAPLAMTARQRYRSLAIGAGFVLALSALTALTIMGGKRFVAAELRPAGAAIVAQLPVDLSDYRHLPTFQGLLKEQNAAALQGRMFCGQFELVGRLFKESLAYYQNHGIPGGASFSRGFPHEDYNTASLLGGTGTVGLPVKRVAISFAGATIERGVKQREKVFVIGRVSQLNDYYSTFFAADGYWFLDALYVKPLAEATEQACDGQ